MDTHTFLPEQIARHKITILPVETDRAVHVCDLPYAKQANGKDHTDPFDRIIVSQSNLAAIPLVSIEEIFDQYGITRIW